MQCEKCKIEHSGVYGSGRFCSTKCARGFATSAARKEISRRVAEKLKGRSTRVSHITSVYQMHRKTFQKVMKRFGLGCFRCGWNEASCDLHHLRGRKIDNPHAHSNLTYICPNCHRLYHSKIISTEELKSFEEVVGNQWEEHYFYGILQKHKEHAAFANVVKASG